MKTYEEFIEGKSQLGGSHGFSPLWMPDFLFDFQKALVEWALLKGRAAIFADCGLGKTPMQLVWSSNVHRKTGKPVLILTPLAVSGQTEREANKFGIEAARSRDGKHSAPIVITNYEKLHLFNAADFAGVVCDESSILKNFDGETKKAVTRFMLKVPFRLLCTATAAPNDYVELGTSSECLGELGYTDMIGRFFIASEKVKHRMEDIKREKGGADEYQAHGRGNHFAKLSFRVSQTINRWTLKGHADAAFWKWVCSWARACRKPSDLGFDDGRFTLPELTECQHTVEPKTPPDGELFTMPAFGLAAERDERKRTLAERVEYAANLVNHGKPAVVWCHFNTEGDLLAKQIAGAIQVKGAMSDEAKEEAFRAFQDGDARVMVIKPKIGAFGLNWQHCAHVVTYATHSYEQYYQAVRRCWRFGQTQPVKVDIISTTGEVYVRDNMRRKAKAADAMFAALVARMNESESVRRHQYQTNIIELPQWIS